MVRSSTSTGSPTLVRSSSAFGSVPLARSPISASVNAEANTANSSIIPATLLSPLLSEPIAATVQSALSRELLLAS